MGTFTAQILVGGAHPNDGGMINLTHELYLSENSIPGWHLVPSFFQNDEGRERIVWIPTLEHMLEDALLMIGVYVLKDKELVDMANRYIKKKSNRKAIGLYDDVAKDDLLRMYERARQIESGHKIIINVFEGSSIRRQLKVLEEYEFDLEVCLSSFKREYSMWSGKKEIRGLLDSN